MARHILRAWASALVDGACAAGRRFDGAAVAHVWRALDVIVLRDVPACAGIEGGGERCIVLVGVALVSGVIADRC